MRIVIDALRLPASRLRSRFGNIHHPSCIVCESAYAARSLIGRFRNRTATCQTACVFVDLVWRGLSGNFR